MENQTAPSSTGLKAGGATTSSTPLFHFTLSGCHQLPPLSKCPLDSIQAAPDQSMAAVLAHEKLVNAHLPYRKMAHSGLQGNLKAAARPTGVRHTRMNLELKWRPEWESETHCFHKKIPTQTVFLPIPASPQSEYLARE